MNRVLVISAFSILVIGSPAILKAGMGASTGNGYVSQPPTDLSQKSLPQQSATPQAKQAQKGPDAATPYNEGIAFVKAKNYGAAVPKFEAALKADPKLPFAHLLAAFCLRKLGPANYPASLQHLNAALKLNPNLGEAYESRGVLYVKMGKKEEAEKDLATLKQLNPKLTPGLEAAIKTGKDVDTY